MELILKIRPADHEKESLRLFAQYYRHLLKRHWKNLLTTYILYLSGGVLGLFLTSFFMRSGDVSRFLLNHELFSEEEKLTLLHLVKDKNISILS